MKPLFIFLKGIHFDSFRAGTKPGMEEFRPYGRRWNESTCVLGREVVLSRGYNGERLMGVITGFRVSEEPTRTEAWKGCYGERYPGVPAACIRISLVEG